MPCKSSRAGGASPRTDALIGPATFGDVQKNGLCKTTREWRARSSLSWLSWTVELVEATLPVFAATPYNARRSAGRSPRNQPSEGV